VVYEALGETLRMNFVVAFLELWLGMTSLELLLGMADGHEQSLSCGSYWRVLSVLVCVLWLIQMGLGRLPSLALTRNLVVLEQIRTMVRIGNSTWRYGVWFVAGFPHMFYKLWLVGGGNKGYLEVII